MTSYRGVEAVDCVGGQTSVEPAYGLCGNHKPNRFLRIERKRMRGSVFCRASILSEERRVIVTQHKNDILFRAAQVWAELTEYQYIFTYGYKKRLYTIHLNFSFEDFPHLAGFQYLKDLALPRYHPRKIVDRILLKKLTLEQIQKGIQYETMVKPRLEALINLKDILETDFHLFSYMPRMYPFTTTIRADYLISHHSDCVSFVFIIQSTQNNKQNDEYLCCSAFVRGERNYEANQRIRTILRKECIHRSSGESRVFYNKLDHEKESRVGDTKE